MLCSKRRFLAYGAIKKVLHRLRRPNKLDHRNETSCYNGRCKLRNTQCGMLSDYHFPRNAVSGSKKVGNVRNPRGRSFLH